MKTEKEIRNRIKKIENDYSHVLTGTLATITINAPRALMQLSAESRLEELYSVIGEKYQSKLKGID